MTPCINFQPLDHRAVCLIGRNPELDCCDTCPGYFEDGERQPCEVWTRVMGYHRPVSAFNAGKQAEHRERKAFRESQ